MNAEAILKEAALACEYARRYNCSIEVHISNSPFRPALNVAVTPNGVVVNDETLEIERT